MLLPSSILLLTPPFTQLNTPYPATAYLKGFLNTKKISAVQADLGIEVILKVFSKKGLSHLFQEIERQSPSLDENTGRIIALKEDYIRTIDDVILFLQGKRDTLAHAICSRYFLPEANRFGLSDDLKWAFGNMGRQDKAKYLATMYLEDLSDLIKSTIDEHFGFSRYAEKLGRSANSFDELYSALQQPPSYLDRILLQLFENKITSIQPSLVAMSVPFPGNLFTAFRCAQWLR